MADDHETKQNVLKAEHEKKIQAASTLEEKQELEDKLQENLEKEKENFHQIIQKTVQTALEDSQQKIVKELETRQEQKRPVPSKRMCGPICEDFPGPFPVSSWLTANRKGQKEAGT